METVSGDDWGLAMDRWLEYPHDDAGKRYMEFLGVTSYYHCSGAGFRMATHAAQKLRLLLGPYHQVIIKAWYQRK